MAFDQHYKLPFREYTGKALLTLDEDKAVPIVQDILFHGDYVILVAEPKVGKTIFALQLACSISSGTPFLDTFDVPKPLRIWYFATEGKDEDIKQRLINMRMKIPLNEDNFHLICSQGFRFNTDEGRRYVKHLLETHKETLPKVIFIDALYLAMKGSLTDDAVVNDFTYEVKRFAQVCDASVFLIHHTKRPTIVEGKLISPTKQIDNIFGSTFLTAGADHLFHMAKRRDSEQRLVICESQRSGNVAEEMTLELMEPSPLYFRVEEPYVTHEEQIRHILRDKPHTIKQLMKETKLSRATIYRILTKFKSEIDKTQGRPVQYLWREGTKTS